MYKEKDSPAFLLLFFLLFPYLMTVLILGRNACPLSREISLEEYVPAVTASQISWDSSKEAIKVQTVAARSNLYAQQNDSKENLLIQEAAEYIRDQEMNRLMLEKYQVFLEAARETRGQVLKEKGEVREIPYHFLSSGKTRNGTEILGEDYGYLSSADTSGDIESPDYVKGCYFSKEKLENKIREYYPGFSLDEKETVEVKAWDLAGYVLEIQIGDQKFQGEEIKELLELPSSCFTVQKLEKEIRFLCRGQGHGLGISQYTVQQMSLEGKKYEEILSYFFPELKIETVGTNGSGGGDQIQVGSFHDDPFLL